MMGIQEILVAILFLIALAYVAKIVYRSINPKKGCGECFKCHAADFSEIKPDKG